MGTEEVHQELTVAWNHNHIPKWLAGAWARGVSPGQQNTAQWEEPWPWGQTDPALHSAPTVSPGTDYLNVSKSRENTFFAGVLVTLHTKVSKTMPSYHFSSQPPAVLTMQCIIIFLFCVLTSFLLLLLLFISPTRLKSKRATDHSCLAHICPQNLAHSRKPHKSIFNSIFIHSVKISFSSFDPSTESNSPQRATKASGFLEIFIAAFTPKTMEKRARGNL